NAVPPKGTNEDLGLVTALLVANEGGGDAACKDLRKRPSIIGQAFEFLVASTTTFGAPRSGMRHAKIEESTYLLLSSRLQMVQRTDSTQSPSTNPYTNPYRRTRPSSASTDEKSKPARKRAIKERTE
ncbi:unnamed protein product, partial [Ascophyllum nodosum]